MITQREADIPYAQTFASMQSKSVTALVIGDPHFKVANIRETDKMVETIVKIAKEKQPDIIVVLGDVLDRHETIHVSPLTRAIKFLSLLMNIAPTFVLIGNHDLKNNRQFLSDEHPFNSLKYWDESWHENLIQPDGNTDTSIPMKRMTIVDTTILVTIKDQIFVFVPYVPPGRFEEALNKCPGWEKATCIFGHQEFNGAQMGAIISTEGDKWPLKYPYVVTGHIHDYQELQVNILYTGTPIQHAFGDRHDKTISYFTFYSPINRDHQRIDLALPRKHIVRITCAEVSTYIPQPNCELKIIIRGTSGDIKAIIKHPNIDIWKRAGYKIVYKDTPLNVSDIIHDDINENKPIISKSPLRFSTVLYNNISNNSRLQFLYTKMFGKISTAYSTGNDCVVLGKINDNSFSFNKINEDALINSFNKDNKDNKQNNVLTLNVKPPTLAINQLPISLPVKLPTLAMNQLPISLKLPTLAMNQLTISLPDDKNANPTITPPSFSISKPVLSNSMTVSNLQVEQPSFASTNPFHIKVSNVISPKIT